MRCVCVACVLPVRSSDSTAPPLRPGERVVPVVGTFALHQAHSESRCRPRRPMAWLRPRPPPLWGDAITQTALGLACWSYLRDIQRRRPPSRPKFITCNMSTTKSLSRGRRPQPKLLRTLESTRRVPVALSACVRVPPALVWSCAALGPTVAESFCMWSSLSCPTMTQELMLLACVGRVVVFYGCEMWSHDR